MSAAFDLWGRHLIGVPDPPDVETHADRVTGRPYCIDWTRRRLVPVGECGRESRCLHGEPLTVWCEYCEGDLDVLAADMLP